MFSVHSFFVYSVVHLRYSYPIIHHDIYGVVVLH